jgi:hypothetical protein
MPVVRRLLLATVLTALAVSGGVVVLEEGGVLADEPTTTSTPLASFDTSRVTILRTGFCDRMPDAAVSEALDAEPEDGVAYDNGDRIRLAAGVRDRAHEYGCSWTAGDSTATAWVFAPPVPRSTADDLLREARGERGCEPIPETPAYGRPSAGLVCTTGPAQEVSFRGLFGDAWLVCRLASGDVSAGQSVEAAVDRAGRWCVAVARAAGVDEEPR